MNSTLRLLLSGVVAFVFYFAWAYWVNSGPEIPAELTLRSALVQGGYSGLATFFFTLLLEFTNRHVSHRFLSLAFMVPILCYVHSPTRQAGAIRVAMNDALDYSATWAKGSCIPGVVLAPLLPLCIQSILVIALNLANNTPNLWLTVTPSILFSGLYAYSYSFTLFRKRHD
ncbi:hypothetical protein [Alteromonas facilis]|uniref:hypothetical protein n=1 Tax=Alteromonas facilis TaxID=2048004 RepID=UPI000C28DC6E|nr:hypothetical protein [Alteromonas facilis]